MRIVHRVTAALPDSIALAKNFQPAWSDILVFDGKVIKVYDEFVKVINRKHYSKNELLWKHKVRWLCGVDYGTSDLPHYCLQGSEGFIDLVIYFKALKSLPYRLKAIICDGNPAIVRAVRFVFGKAIIVQRCTRHFLEELRRLLPTEEEKQVEREKLEQLIVEIKQIIQAKDLAEASHNYCQLKRHSRHYRSPLARKMIKMFEQAKDHLTSYLQYPELNLPRTTNDVENLFKQLNTKVQLIERFQKFYYADNYLKAWALLRRFTPYTDCKGQRRCRNKKAPLELAAVDISNIDPLKLRK